MSSFPFDRSFSCYMSECLLRCVADFKVDNKLVPWEEIISYPAHLTELSAMLCRQGWPLRTGKEIREEIVRLHERWKKKQLTYKTESMLRYARINPSIWIEESEDEDDIFMPSVTSQRAAAAAAAKAKRGASSKGKRDASSKGKGAALADRGGCIDGR